MSIFNRKPRCPSCSSKRHTDPEYHLERARELAQEVKALRALLERSNGESRSTKNALTSTYAELYWHCEKIGVRYMNMEFMIAAAPVH